MAENEANAPEESVAGYKVVSETEHTLTIKDATDFDSDGERKPKLKSRKVFEPMTLSFRTVWEME